MHTSCGHDTLFLLTGYPRYLWFFSPPRQYPGNSHSFERAMGLLEAEGALFVGLKEPVFHIIGGNQAQPFRCPEKRLKIYLGDLGFAFLVCPHPRLTLWQKKILRF
jgi:hypothetical protein